MRFVTKTRRAACAGPETCWPNVDSLVVDATVTDPLVGKFLDGRYRVEGLIARGGMATVYRGLDTRLDRQIAIKVMHPSFAEDPEFVARFTREARSAARLSDQHVVSVFDQGNDDGVVFLVMEYIAGRTLRDLLAARGRLNPREALNVMTPVVEALAAAHRSGLVHRDIKPENVLIGDDGRVRVTDFGLARAANASGTNNATREVLMGTMAYLAPEQVSPGISDERSDLYAAGIVLFELLTGKVPFDGDDSMAVAYRHVHEDVPAPSSLVEGIPSSVDNIVLAATRRDPTSRPESAAALLAMMQSASSAASTAAATAQPDSTADQLTVVVPLAGAAAAAAAPRNTAVTPLVEENTLSDATGSGEGNPADAALKSKRRSGWVALVLVLALAIGAGGFAWWLSAGSTTTVPTVAGLVGKQAEAKLAELGLSVDYANPEFSEIVPKDDVISSDPASGEEIADGGTVTLTLSKGPERYAVPDLAGESVNDARELIRDQNLTVGSIKRQYHESVPQGDVISSSPEEGVKVRPDTNVTLVVSKGLPPVPIPNVVGNSQAAAKQELQDAGLTMVVSGREHSTSVPKGSVVSQEPASGVQVDQGSTITVVISLGPELVEIPEVFGRSTDDATSILENAGFKVRVSEECFVACIGRVGDQEPNGGVMAPKGSTVTLFVV